MKLLFIYNANSGKLNALFDVGHKLFSPSTYPCSLCTLTYDTFSENKIWKTFRKESHFDMIFYHKDEFENIFPNIEMLCPIILKREQNKFTTVLSSNDLNKITSTEELIEQLKITL